MKYVGSQFMKVVTGITAVSTTGTVTTSDTGIDTKGFDQALVIFNCGTIAATGDVTVTVEEAGTNAAASFATITGASFGEKTASSDLALYVGNIDLRPRKRYIRVKMAMAAATAGIGAASVVLLGAASLPCTPEAAASFTV